MSPRAFLPLLLLAAAPVPAVAQSSNHQPHIDLVIAVDVSGSMKSLLEATRLKLWDVVRLLGRAKPLPQIRVGLISYGGKFANPQTGYVTKEIDLTTDLDAVSARLFALPARGSQEYVARAVQTATQQMAWDQDPAALKILFVAGNESAEQDPLVSLSAALGAARQRGIHVNTIFCGNADAREAVAWRQVAALGNGEFAAIDHHQSVVAAVSPYDAELAHLSTELSRTYVAYGKDGSTRHANQIEQDKRAAKDGLSIVAERAGAKASLTYQNADWDAVDAYAEKKPIGGMLAPDVAALPAPQREAYLRNKLTERRALQSRIEALADNRQHWLAAGGDGAATAPPTGAPAKAKAEPRGETLATSAPAPMASLEKSASATPTVAAVPASPRPTVAAPSSRKATAKKASATMSDAFSGAVERIATKNGYSF